MFTLVVVILSVAAVSSANEIGDTKESIWDCIDPFTWGKPCKEADISDRANHEVPFESVGEALKVIDLSIISNYPFNEMEKKLNAIGWKLISKINHLLTDTEGFIAQDKENGDLAVSFRGTELRSIIDWITDLTALPVDLGNGVRVHAGFNRAVKSIYASTVKIMTNNIQSGKKIYITGISLGAGVAQIFAYKFARDFPSYRSQLRMYSYATPPSGNSQFVHQLYQFIPQHHDIEQIGDKVAYKRCCIGVITHLLGYRRDIGIQYLPDKGAHNPFEYKAQLKKIQTKEAYDAAYGFTYKVGFYDLLAKILQKA
jgi:hypothetical protein